MKLRQYRVELLSVVIILFSVLLIFTQNQLQDRKLSSSLRMRDKIVSQTRAGNKTSVKEEIVTLVATGDVMLGRMVNFQMTKNDDPYLPFRKVKNVLESADITYINLENPLVDPCPLSSGGMIFCAPTLSVTALSFAGVDVVNLANNHSRNYGQRGYDSTVEFLEEETILYSDSENVAEVEVEGTKFGFIGFDLVSKNWSDGEVTAKIADSAKEVNVLVVGFHWGNEYQKKSNATQKKYGRAAVDAGADLVIGHHPHVVQELEEYNGSLIVYSLGNFVFDQQWSEVTREGVVGVFNFKDDQLFSYEFVPIYINDLSQPEIIADSEKAERILSSLRDGN